MICRKCQSNLADGETICPSCGYDNSKRPVNGGKLALVILAVLAAVALIVLAVVGIVRQAGQDETEPSEPTSSLSATGEVSGAMVRDSYVFTGEDISAELDKTVVTMGDSTLTNRLFQVVYWMSYYDFMNTYGGYSSSIGLDTTKPLGEQQCAFSQGTWEQYFVDAAVRAWAQYQALKIEADEAEFTLSQDSTTQLESLHDTLQESASNAGFETVDEMLQADFGAGVTEDVYREYLTMFLTSMEYYYAKVDEMEISEEDIEFYFETNAATFEQQGITKETPATISVRHILLSPDGEKVGDSYTTEQLKQAREKAEAVYQEWKDGDATVESFAALATEKSEDPGSKSNGGLYENVTPGQMLQTFNDWCFDPARKPGDTGIVDTPYGSHVMYFVEASEEKYWRGVAEDSLTKNLSNSFLQETLEKHAYEVDYFAIALNNVSQVKAS